MACVTIDVGIIVVDIVDLVVDADIVDDRVLVAIVLVVVDDDVVVVFTNIIGIKCRKTASFYMKSQSRV